MTNPLPKWVQQRYAVLWKKFDVKFFTHEQAAKVLKDNQQLVSVFLSDLKKAGWIEVSLDAKDSRIRLYKLKNPQEAILQMVK